MAVSSFLHISSFLNSQLIYFFPFYFHNSIIDIFHYPIILKHLHLATNEKNLKTEIRLTTLHWILLFKNYKLFFDISSFNRFYMSKFPVSVLILEFIWFIRVAEWIDAAVRTDTLSYFDGAVRTDTSWNKFAIPNDICQIFFI